MFINVRRIKQSSSCTKLPSPLTSFPPRKSCTVGRRCLPAGPSRWKERKDQSQVLLGGKDSTVALNIRCTWCFIWGSFSSDVHMSQLNENEYKYEPRHSSSEIIKICNSCYPSQETNILYNCIVTERLLLQFVCIAVFIKPPSLDQEAVRVSDLKQNILEQ